MSVEESSSARHEPEQHVRAPDAEQLAAALHSSLDLVSTVDLDRRFTSWNAGCEVLYGWRAEEVLGRRMEIYVPDDQLEQLDTCLRALRNGEDVPAVETVRLTRDGRRVDVSLRLSAIRNQAGEMVGGLAIGRDITLEMAHRRELEQTRSHLRARLDQTALAHATLTPDGVFSYVNAAFCRLMGRDHDELIGKNGLDLSPPHRRRSNEQLLRQLSLEGHHATEPRTIVRPDGSVAHVIAHLSPITSPDGQIDGIALTVQDVTDVHRLETALRAQRARFRSLALHAFDVGFLADPDGTLQYASEALGARFGYTQEQVLGRTLFEFCHPDDVGHVESAWEQVVAGRSGELTVEARIRLADGSWAWGEGTFVNLLHDPDVAAVVVTARDVSSRKAIERSLGEVALCDQLTGVANRVLLLDRTQHALERVRTSGLQVGLLLLDLDEFALVNAEFGHAAGDEVLVSVAQLLEATLAPLETVARPGGDRFAVLVEDVESLQALERRAQQVQALLLGGVGARERTIRLSASIGLTASAGGDATAVLGRAETALRTAKARGRESIAVFDESVQGARQQRRDALADLRRGLAADELVMHYQPVIDLRTGAAVGTEALVRWQHPDRGLLPPSTFLDLAEESRLILPLGGAVLRKACADAVGWDRHQGRDLSLAVNLSMRQITEPGLIELVRDALAETGLRPTRLVLEVTETAVAADIATTSATLSALRELGVQVAIDDFGTGYSSLTYLRQFPVTAVKIDRSFVQGLGVDSDDTAIVNSVIALSNAVGVDCIAEGVEERAQAHQLRTMGCELAQGFLWSRPLPQAELVAWLAAAPTPSGPDGSGRPATVSDASDSAPRGTPLDAVRERVRQMQRDGASLHTIAAALNAEGVLTPTGIRWHVRSVARFIQHLDDQAPPA